MPEIDDLFNTLIAQNGSDLHLEEGQKPKIRIHGQLREVGNETRLVFEHFGLPTLLAGGDGSAPQNVRAERSGISFAAGGGKSLLVEAEAAGLTPAYGCRMGICQTCRCRKVSGIVEDLRTDRLSQEPNESIQLCVSAARSPVTLDL